MVANYYGFVCRLISETTTGAIMLDLSFIIGKQFSSVTFVMDYYQFSFDGVWFNVMTDPIVETNEQKFFVSSPGFRDALVDLIPKIVTNARVEEKELVIELDHSCIIRIPSVREGNGGEAVIITGEDERNWWVLS